MEFIASAMKAYLLDVDGSRLNCMVLAVAIAMILNVREERRRGVQLLQGDGGEL
jgi:hypothetical protein